MMGPLNTPRYCTVRCDGHARSILAEVMGPVRGSQIKRLVKKSCETMPRLRLVYTALPWREFVPLFITRLICAPEKRPSEASYAAVWTRNSCTISCGGLNVTPPFDVVGLPSIANSVALACVPATVTPAGGPISLGP